MYRYNITAKQRYSFAFRLGVFLSILLTVTLGDQLLKMNDYIVILTPVCVHCFIRMEIDNETLLAILIIQRKLLGL